MKKAILALAVLLAFTAGCGSSSKSDTPKLSKADQKISKGIADFVAKGSQGIITQKQARCFSDKFVAKAGVAKLKTAKLLKSDGTVASSGAKFDKPLATEYVDAYFGCVDYAALEAKAVAAQDTTVDATKLTSCLHSKIKESDSKALVVSSLIGTPDQTLNKAQTATAAACQASSKKVQ